MKKIQMIWRDANDRAKNTIAKALEKLLSEEKTCGNEVVRDDEIFEKELAEAKTKAVKKCSCGATEDLWYCELCQEYHCEDYPDCD